MEDIKIHFSVEELREMRIKAARVESRETNQAKPTQIIQDKRTKRNRTRSDKNRKAILESKGD